MKKIISNLFFLVLLLSFTGCESYLVNGDLDGLWQVQTIEDRQTGDITPANGELYFAFQRDMVQLGYKYPDKVTGQIMTHYNAYFDITGDSIRMGDFRKYMEYDKKVPLESLKMFGMFDEYTTFDMEKLTRKELILTSYRSRLVMKKY